MTTASIRRRYTTSVSDPSAPVLPQFTSDCCRAVVTNRAGRWDDYSVESRVEDQQSQSNRAIVPNHVETGRQGAVAGSCIVHRPAIIVVIHYTLREKGG